MSMRRVSLVSLGVSSLLGAVVACGDSSDSPSNVWVSAYADKASVSLGLYDATGAQVGTCAGTLIGPTTVLTAGHCIAGKTSWQVTASGANGVTAKGYRGVTYDWQNFQSSLSHPVHVDLGVVILEKPILLDHYPTLATTPLADGASAARIRRTDRSAGATSFESVDSLVLHGTSKGFAFDYLTDATVNEVVDTGGALLDPQTNVIYGVVSGRGNDSGMMHIARVDVINRWMSNKLLCHNKNQPVMGTRCHPAGASSSSGGSSSGGASCGKDAGAGGSSGGTSGSGGSSGSGHGGSSGSSGASSGGAGGGAPTDCENPSSGGGGGGSSGGSGGSSGGGMGGSSGSGATAGSPSGSQGSSSGSLGGGGGSNNGLVGPGDNGGICWGSCPGQATLPPSTNGGTGGGETTGSGGSGSGSPAGAGGGGGSAGSSSGGTGGGGSGSGSPSGANGSGSGSPAGAGGGSGAGSGSGSGVVVGTQQNPVPDSTGCVGSICGGCFAACGDDTLDYGDCGCTGASSSGSGTPIK